MLASLVYIITLKSHQHPYFRNEIKFDCYHSKPAWAASLVSTAAYIPRQLMGQVIPNSPGLLPPFRPPCPYYSLRSQFTQGFARTFFGSHFLRLQKRTQERQILVQPLSKPCTKFVLGVSAHVVRAIAFACNALSIFMVCKLETQDEERFGAGRSAILRLKSVCAQNT